MRGTPSLRRDLVDTARELHRQGWVANHDGNVSARDGNGYLATPTATSKRLVDERNLVALDSKGVAVSGKVFGEIGLHLVVYERRPDVGAVVHAHPPYATAIASSGHNPIARPFIAEALVSLGPIIPKTAYAAPGEPARAALAPWCELVDAVLPGNHGVIAWGASLEQALLRLELVEHLAKIATLAAPHGGIAPLSDDALPALMNARAKAGLGRAADRAVSLLASAPASASGSAAPVKPVVACAPAPHSSQPIAERPARPNRSQVEAVVREEIMAALRSTK